MLLLLKRKWFTNKSTIGELFVNGIFFCFTIEDVARPPGVKIPKQTCIQAGEYDVVLDFSQRFQRIMPHVLWVNLFEGIRIHIANSSDNVEGCIGVGYHRGLDVVWQSKDAFDVLFAQMEEMVARGEKIRLVITNEQDTRQEE